MKQFQDEKGRQTKIGAKPNKYIPLPHLQPQHGRRWWLPDDSLPKG